MVEQRKTKSYKAIVGAVVAGLVYLAANGSGILPAWAILIILTITTGATVWLTKNPEK